ncbi:MAG: hypothetical protein HWN65_03130 [Candidatus Helarchaeota archaeon]|nr:hypothetical protein [Candidatus Helarchaeota archaeon]
MGIITGVGFYVWLDTTLKSAKNEFDLFFNGFDVESSLIDEAYINYTLLDLRAQQIEKLIGLYHIPFNMTGEGWDYYPPVGVRWSYTSARFYNNSELLATFDPSNESSPFNDRNNMTYSGDRGHTALYEGVYTAGEAFRYAWAKRNNETGNMTAALNRIWKLVKGYDLLSNVSSQSAFVRYAVPDTSLARQMFPGHWETEDHDVVEYRGFNWSLSRHLSRDVSIGIMFGLSMVYALVNDSALRATVGRIIDKTVQYWYNCNWRLIDTDGTQHESGDFVGFRPYIDGTNILTFLQMGKMVNPDKWGPVYLHYVYDRGLVNTIGRSMKLGVDLTPKIYDGYYGCNFMYNNAPTLIWLETDPELRELYLRNWLNIIHDFTKFHRNANFDVVWLLCHTEIQENLYDPPTITLHDYDLEIWSQSKYLNNPTDKDYIKNFTVRDIKDSLMRYAVRRYPNRDYYWATTPGTFPNQHQQEINLSGYIVPYPQYDYWEPTTELGNLIVDVLSLFGREIKDEGILNNSLPVDMRKAEDIMWQRRSFTVATTERTTNNPGTFQVPMGPEYLSVYWMAKYLELF